jgi:CheY-like chemotaxis protein
MDNCDRTVLVVEDNAALASVVRFNLERAGLQTAVAYNGREAWDRVQEQQFDLIVTDQQMPEMSGCEFCERLRQLANYDEVPIILLTAKGMELELPRLRTDLGIAATFIKPFSPKEVVKAVEDQLAAVS